MLLKSYTFGSKYHNVIISLLDPQSVLVDSVSSVNCEVMNYDFNLVSPTFSLISCKPFIIFEFVPIWQLPQLFDCWREQIVDHLMTVLVLFVPYGYSWCIFPSHSIQFELLSESFHKFHILEILTNRDRVMHIIPSNMLGEFYSLQIRFVPFLQS